MKKVFWINLIISLGFLGIFTLAFTLSPDPRGFGTHEHLFLPPCLFKWVTGLPCPSCGLTTSFAYLAKGHLYAAFRVNFMGPIIFVLFFGMAIYSLFSLFQKKPFWRIFEKSAVPFISILLMLGLLAQWIFKVYPIVTS